MYCNIFRDYGHGRLWDAMILPTHGYRELFLYCKKAIVKAVAEAQCAGTSVLGRQLGEVETVDNQQALALTKGHLLLLVFVASPRSQPSCCQIFSFSKRIWKCRF